MNVEGEGEDILYAPPGLLPSSPLHLHLPRMGGSAVRMVSNCTSEPEVFPVGKTTCAGTGTLSGVAGLLPIWLFRTMSS